MGFFTPNFPRRRFVTASLIGVAWLLVIGLLWALPNGGYRRGWSYEHYGVLEAFTRVRDYRTTGEIVGFKPAGGFVPSVVITILVTVAAIVSYRWLIPRRGRKPGHCPTCGYDLRGTVSDTCSECGEVLGKKTGRSNVSRNEDDSR